MVNVTARAEMPTAPLTIADRRRPGRPRSARVDENIIDAVIGLLVAGTTAEALSIEAVAAKAKVGKATVYRRWANKDALLVDAVAALKGPLPDLGGGCVRDDLVALLRPVGRPATSLGSTVLPSLIAELERSPTLRQCFQKVVEPRRELMRSVLRRGMASGELRADLDVEIIMAMLIGPMLARTVLSWDDPLADTAPSRLVDALWPAIAAT